MPLTAEGHLELDLQQAAEEMRYLDDLALYNRIRADHAIVGVTIPKLAHAYMLGEDPIAKILHGRLPRLSGSGRRRYKQVPTLEPVKDLIHQMWRQNCPPAGSGASSSTTTAP